MDRKEFLSLLGIGAAAVACSYCLQGCQQNTGPTAPTNVDFTLDLTAAQNSGLTAVGGYLYNNGVIVAHVQGGSYVAVSSICTHAGGTVYYDLANNRFHCPNHGSNFAVDGTVINGPAASPLMKYNTALTGNSLRVYS